MPSLRCPETGKFLLQLGMYIDSKGYWAFSQSGPNRNRRVHRVMMEQHLGRKLRKDEICHHRDGNKLNNEEHPVDGKWNLELMGERQHNAVSAKQYWFLKTFIWPLEKKAWDEYHAHAMPHDTQIQHAQEA